MAKGSNNIRSRPSDASKPYDVSNSLVKRVASRVTGLLPQPSWLSRWISPASVPNANDFTSHSRPSAITSRPPATSRAELNLVDDIDHHVPAKKPRTNRYNSPVNQTKFLRSGLYNAEDISPIAVRGEPVAGPSSAHPEFISSTPAIHVHQQNTTKVNGDDCSETSESTSGCSSLVPQAQSTTRNLGGSRYERMLPPGSNMDTLQRRQPSFSTTTFASPLRASMRERLGSSPFYSGRTMYGGSSQAYLSTIHSPQRRVGPTVRPMPAQQSMPLSSTAKRILDALEQFSTPVLDAKRMPVAVGSKRKMVSCSQRYTELSVPSTPDLLRVKRRERLQQSTSAARQTASASLPESQPPTEYTIRKDEESDRKKHTGKVKTKDKVSDEAVVEVKLPAVVLSMDNLPKIDIAIPPAPPSKPMSVAPTSCKFMFASPTIVPLTDCQVSSVNIPTSSFKFSAPISETSDSHKPMLSCSVSSLSRTSSDNVTSNPKRHRSKDDSEPLNSLTSDSKNVFCSSGEDNSWKVPSSTTSVTIQPVIKVSECKHCHKKIENPNTPCFSCHKAQDKDETNSKMVSISNLWECQMCKNSNPSSCEACVLCQTKKVLKPLDASKNNVKSSSTTGFGNLYNKPVGTWECSTCMIQNKNELNKCIACESSKPSQEIRSSKSINTSSSVTSSFGDQFKQPSGSWECQTCMINNKPKDLHCVACETPKAGTKSATISKTETLLDTKQSTNGFADLFKKAPGSWTCDSCMITNKADVVKCVACETVKPGATLPKSSESSTPKYSFGIPATVATGSSNPISTFSFGINKSDQSITAQDTASAMPKTSASTDNSQPPLPSQTFSFGIPKIESDNTSGVTSSTPSKPVFQFGSASSQAKVSESKSMFANAASTTKQNVPDNLFGNVVTNLPVKNEDGKETKSGESAKPEFGTVSNVHTPNISNVVKPVITSFGVSTEKTASVPEKTSNTASLFTFGTNKVTQNDNDKLNDANSLTKLTQSTFMYGTKQGNYGSNVASSTTSTLSPSSSSNVFKFGDTKSVSSGADMSSIPSVNTQPSFTTAKSNSIFSFGSNTEKKEASFGVKETVPASTASLPTNESKSTFGSFGVTTSQSPSFGNTGAFGSNSTFGSKEQSPFVQQTASTVGTTTAVFGTTETTNASSTSSFTGFGHISAFQSPAPENKPSAVFTFGSTPSKESIATGGFVFNPIPEKRAESGFGFPATPSGPTFNFNSTSSTPTASFNFEPKPFGSTASPFSTASDAPTTVFGTSTAQQPTPTFGGQTNPNPMFAFGSQPAQPSQPPPANPIFEFGSNQQNTPVAPAPSTTFVFGATSAAQSTPSFDPNIRPTFNFTQGSTPVFSAIPTVNSATASQPPTRKIRKAVRRTNISSVRQT